MFNRTLSACRRQLTQLSKINSLNRAYSNEPPRGPPTMADKFQKSQSRRRVIFLTTGVLLGVSLYYVYSASQERVINQLQKREYGTSPKDIQHKPDLTGGAPVLRSHIAVSKRTIVEIEVCHGDITMEPTDAIVNAANVNLRHGGGVARMISDKGAPVVKEQSEAWIKANGPLKTGQAAITDAGGSLRCQKVIHTVGPIWQGGNQNEPALLESAVRSALLMADANGLRSISIPAISSGIYGFPKPLCAKIMFDTVLKYVYERDTETRPVSLQVIRLVNFDEPTVSVFTTEFDKRKREGKML